MLRRSSSEATFVTGAYSDDLREDLEPSLGQTKSWAEQACDNVYTPLRA